MTATRAILAGTCASFASLCGKLSGVEINVFNSKLDVALNFICFGLMIVLNGAMWTLFVKALQDCGSLRATVLSSSTNYILSGVMGFLVFSEVTGLLWWTGISLVVIGVLLMNSSHKKQE